MHVKLFSSEYFTGEDIRVVMGLCILLGGLLILSRLVVMLSDTWVMIFVVLLAAPIQYVLFWGSRMRRLAFRKAYIEENSRYFFWLRGGFWMFLLQLLLALFLGGLLLVGVVRQERLLFWVAILILVPVWLKSNQFLAGYLRHHVKDPFHLVLAYRVHTILFGSFLIAALFTWSFFQPVIDVSGMDPREVILALTKDTSTQSVILGAGVDLFAVMDAIRHWLGQNLMEYLPGVGLHIFIWFLILIQEWLIVWPLLLLFQAVHLLMTGVGIQQIREA